MYIYNVFFFSLLIDVILIYCLTYKVMCPEVSQNINLRNIENPTLLIIPLTLKDYLN